jgi:hypothetical protein
MGEFRNYVRDRDLPAGDHTIYWKLWISGGSVTLSGGALAVEAFEPATGPSAIAAVATTEADGGQTVGSAASAAARAPAIVVSTDNAGQPITQVRD